MRTTLLALAAVGSLAFAPAPFPKSNRHVEQDDLKKLQGDWYRVEYEGQPEQPPLHVRIIGDQLNFISASGSYTLAVDPKKRPKRIDIRSSPNEQPPSYRGVYRLDGDTFIYCLRSGVAEADRPLHFDTGRQGAWTAVYKRTKP